MTDKSKILKFSKAIYRLGVASKIWHTMIHGIITSLNNTRSVAEPCIYYSNDGKSNLSISLTIIHWQYFTGQKFWKRSWRFDWEIKPTFWNIKITKNPCTFIGFEIETCDGVLFLHQKTYIGIIQKLIQKYNLKEADKICTPMETKLNVTNTKNRVEHSEFWQIIVSLAFLSCRTQPDICYSVNYLSRFIAKVTN